jgi:hypothetical protein
MVAGASQLFLVSRLGTAFILPQERVQGNHYI